MKALTVRTRHLVAAAIVAISAGATARAGSYTIINAPGAPPNSTFVTGISNNMTIVGNIGGSSSFTYNVSTNKWNTNINVPGAAETLSTAINTSGQLVGYYFLPWQSDFGWPLGWEEFSSGFFVSVVPTGCAYNVLVTGINDTYGTVTGYCMTSSHTMGAFSSFQGGLVFTCFGSIQTQTFAINNEMLMVGNYYTSSGHFNGFIATDQGTCSTITYPGATNTWLTGINNVGDITGYYQKGSGPLQGFFLKGNTYTTYNIPGATNTWLGQINDAGWFVGTFIDSTGYYHAFYAQTTP